ncbi:MAG TPA: fatty acyl-AMP ligase [Abditibacterium sp.]
MIALSEANPLSTTWLALLRERAKQHPNRRAVTFLGDGEQEEGTLSYAELERRARSIAARLQAKNARGERVLLVFNSGLDYVAAFFGCLFAGAVAVPVYPPRLNRNLDRLGAIVNSCQPVIALSTAAVFARIEPVVTQSGLSHLHWLLSDSDDLSEQWCEPLPSLDGEDLAFLQYTSGSTSSPKGVKVSHQNLLVNHRMIESAFELTEGATWVSWLPLFHDMGLIGVLLQSLFVGGHCVLMPPEAFLMKPVRWLEAIERYRAQVSGGPNFAFDLCTRKITEKQRASLDLSCWELAFCGAEPVRPSTLSGFSNAFESSGFTKRSLYPCYGLAEATLFASGGSKSEAPILGCFKASELERNRAVLEDTTSPDGRLLVSCGRPWLDGRIEVVDPDSSRICAQGTIGEVWICGPHVARGYWNLPDESLHSFGAFTATGDGPFLRTGDLGFFYDSELFLTGRSKDVIIVAGRNHHPQDIEASVVKSHPALAGGSCAAFSIELENAEVVAVVAEVHRSQLTRLDSEAVVGAIRQSVAHNHDLRAHVVRLIAPATLPKTSSGKIQRRLCREKLLNDTLSFIN